MSFNKKIFLVEDEGLLRNLVTIALENFGYMVEAVDNAEECIFRLGHSEFDLLITDIMLPGMSGLELLAFTRERLSFMPVIIMTASNEISSAIEALRLGAADYLRKPFKDDELLLRIKRCLEVSDLKSQVEKQGNLEKRLRDCSGELDDVRSAMKALLKRSEQVNDEAKDEVEQNISSTIHALIMPLIAELELLLKKQSPEVTTCLQLVKQNLTEITAPFAHNVTSIKYLLTPREIQMANFIRMGKTSKEIAQLTKITYATVESHRNTIRKKLGIKNHKISLIAFLTNLEQ